MNQKMRTGRESELRMALRHVQQGRRCIERQLKVIATLRDRGLPIGQAEEVLRWLEEWQLEFEAHYYQVLSEGTSRLEVFIEGGVLRRRSPRNVTTTR
jgi:hypothetical protein